MNQHPLRPIAESELQAWAEDGVVHLRGLLDQEWVTRMQRAIDHVLAHPSDHGTDLNSDEDGGRFAYDDYMWKFNDDFRAFVFTSPAAKIAATFLHSQAVNLLYNFFLVKEPHTPTRTNWHHDLPANPVEGPACGLWVSLDHIAAESGAVQWARGSHKWGKRFNPVGSGVGKTHRRAPIAPGLEPMPSIPGHPEDYDIVSFDTEPGYILVTHLLTCHGAPGNATDRRRRAFGVRYAGDGSTYAVRTDVTFNIKPIADPGLAHGDPFPGDPDHFVFPRVLPRRAKDSDPAA